MSNDLFERQRQDFLWYCLFGITKTDAENDKDKALDACIERAYRDMNRTLDYKYSVSYLENNPQEIPSEEFKSIKTDFEKLKNDYINAVKNGIIKAVYKDNIIIVPAINEDFDSWHNKLCNQILKISNDSLEFNHNLFNSNVFYGQAQKWVNMTLKYMLIMGLLDYEKYKLCLHVPIDRYILKQLYNKEGYNNISWSQISLDDYNTIRAEINNKRGNKTPIEWEFDAWIEQAKKENNK